MEEKPHKKIILKKIILAVLVIIALFFLFGGWRAISLWWGQRQIERIAKNWEKQNQELYQKQMVDTYGGKTPQETLQMYIEAVEKGDYELASKYFAIERQVNEKNTLIETSQKGNIDFLLDYLNKAKKSSGYFSTNKDIFTIEEPIFIEFILYPNGIWKIIEI